MRTTHTYVVLPVNPGTYAEIKDKMEANGYEHAIMDARDDTPECLDMHGIALESVEVGPNPVDQLVDYMVAAGYEIDPMAVPFIEKMRKYCAELVTKDITKG